MDKVDKTNRSPRTPPALSNATPRHDENTLRDLLAMMWDKYEDGDPCYEDPNEHAGFIGHAVRLSFEEEEKVLNAIKEPPAAAEPFTPNPVEGRAANPSDDFVARLYKINDWHWKDKHTQEVFGLHGLLERYAADLQRQLDEARRELTVLRNIHGESRVSLAIKLESAEAANQELRRALQEIVDYDDEFSDTTPREIAAAALLGPQHGDTK